MGVLLAMMTLCIVPTRECRSMPRLWRKWRRFPLTLRMTMLRLICAKEAQRVPQKTVLPNSCTSGGSVSMCLESERLAPSQVRLCSLSPRIYFLLARQCWLSAEGIVRDGILRMNKKMHAVHVHAQSEYFAMTRVDISLTRILARIRSCMCAVRYVDTELHTCSSRTARVRVKWHNWLVMDRIQISEDNDVKTSSCGVALVSMSVGKQLLSHGFVVDVSLDLFLPAPMLGKQTGGGCLCPLLSRTSTTSCRFGNSTCASWARILSVCRVSLPRSSW